MKIEFVTAKVRLYDSIYEKTDRLLVTDEIKDWAAKALPLVEQAAEKADWKAQLVSDTGAVPEEAKSLMARRAALFGIVDDLGQIGLTKAGQPCGWVGSFEFWKIVMVVKKIDPTLWPDGVILLKS